MTRRHGLVVAIGIVFFVAIIVTSGQMTAYSNPPANQSIRWDTAEEAQLVPVACANCHNAHMESPWAARVAPASLVVGCNMSQSGR